MTEVKKTLDSSGKLIHYGVAAVIKDDKGRYLIIDRATKPYGYGCISGHINEGEEPKEALIREVKEESGLEVIYHKLILEKKIEGRKCFLNRVDHYCHIFECRVDGKIKRNTREVKSIDWYTKEDIKKLKLEPLWKIFFKTMKVI